VQRRDTDPRLDRSALSAEHRRDTRRRTRGARARGFSLDRGNGRAAVRHMCGGV